MIRSSKLISILVLLAILFGIAPERAVASPPGQGEYTFDECNRIDEESLRDELNRIAQAALFENSINIEQIVQRQWIVVGMDTVVDTEVDAAIEKVRSEEDYLNRLWSAWSAEKAQEYAGRVANYAFGSPAFKEAIEELSRGVADSIAIEIETASVRSASNAMLCIQAFIGQRYSERLVEVFESDIRQQMAEIDLSELDSDVSILGQHSTALAGIGVIIGTQIARRLAQKLAQRLAGRIAGRILGRAAASLVPIAGWIVGAGLIAWDLYEGSDGALPQIAEALKGPDVKAEIRSETVSAIEPELERELPIVAREVADNIYSNWLDFKGRYETIINLADENPTFSQLLSAVPTENIYKFVRLVSVSAEVVDESELESAIESGAMERMLSMPESAVDILEGTQSIDTVLAWSDVAGGMLDQVVALEIYKAKSPEDFDRNTLTKLVALNDSPTVAKLLLLDARDLQSVLSIPTEALKRLSKEYSIEDLTWLAAYLSEIENPNSRAQLIAQLVEAPASIEQLKSERVKDALVNDSDLDETLDFLARPRSPQAFVIDTFALWNGDVSWRIHVQKYGLIWGIMLVILILVTLRFTWWYFRPFWS